MIYGYAPYISHDMNIHATWCQERQKVQAALDVALAEARETREAMTRESQRAESRTSCLEADLEHRTQVGSLLASQK